MKLGRNPDHGIEIFILTLTLTLNEECFTAFSKYQRDRRRLHDIYDFYDENESDLEIDDE